MVRHPCMGFSLRCGFEFCLLSPTVRTGLTWVSYDVSRAWVSSIVFSLLTHLFLVPSCMVLSWDSNLSNCCGGYSPPDILLGSSCFLVWFYHWLTLLVGLGFYPFHILYSMG